jgi:hypothetical protein
MQVSLVLKTLDGKGRVVSPLYVERCSLDVGNAESKVGARAQANKKRQSNWDF